jgi:hypothetical protein
MEYDMNRLRTTVETLWRASRPLTATGFLMLLALAASLVAMAVDHSRILGAPTWLKPSKFAISTAVYAFTLAWLFTYLPERRRLTAVVGWLIASILAIEVAIIDIQAARGVTSHFNVGTPLDAALFSIMGTGILLAWGAAIALTIALFRQRFADQGLGWAIRVGMLMTVLGQATGGFMTTPTRAQLEAASASPMIVAGAHTVGAPDGGPGLPVAGWSREHGDLRVPHFVGLHAVQFLPAIALLIGPLASPARRRRVIVAAAAAYASLFGMLLAQALAGQPVLAPRGPIAALLAAWAIAVAASALAVVSTSRGRTSNGRLAMMVSK